MTRRATPVILAASLALGAACAFAGTNIDKRDVRVEYEDVDSYRATLVTECVRYAQGQLREDLGLAIPPRVTVKLVRGGGAFVGMSRGRPVELYAGLAEPSSATILINMNEIDRDTRADAYTKTIRHELVHLAIRYSLGDVRLPKWFEEGLACEFGSPLPRPEAPLLAAGRAPSLSSLWEFPRGKERLGLAYAQSDSVLRFLTRTKGVRAVKAVLHRVGAGERFEDALVAATGHTSDSLDAAWRGTLWPFWGWRVVRFIFGPSMVLLWAALIAIVGYFVVKGRRRREAESLDSGF